MTKTKTSARIKDKNPARSETIDQCVIYAQSIGAFNAGFEVDHTKNSEHAGCDGLGKKHIRKAKRALHRLIALSPACIEGRAPLTRKELAAKAGVLKNMAPTGGTLEFDPIEKVFLRLFAREVEDYCQAEVAS
jgi:hypothetical protein